MPAKSLDYYCRAFSRLHRDNKMGGAPHKPVLLLSILDAFEYQEIVDNRIFITPELIGLFKANWTAFVITEHQPRFALPFYHMRSEPFWKLVPNDGCEIWVESRSAMKGISNLVTAVNHALIDSELEHLFKNPQSRSVLRTTLIGRYFPHSAISSVGEKGLKMIELVESNMVKEPSQPEYLSKLKSQESLSEEEEEDVVIRGGLFKRLIPRIYGYSCCISGMSINTSFNAATLIEACHIKPFSVSFDDSLSNGLALCPTLHKAFDAGILSISENFRVLVSNKIYERESPQNISQFAGKLISLPNNKAHFPRIENLKWHSENVFEKGR